MSEFMQTFLIAVIPSISTGILAYLASIRNANTQICAIKEQNRADIDKLVEQNKVDIESLKEKHTLEMEVKEKEHSYQIELIKLQHDNDLKKDQESMKNQFAVNALGSMFGGMFSQDSPISGKLNEAIGRSLDEAMNKKDNKENEIIVLIALEIKC